MPYTEHCLPLLISVRGGPGGGCSAVLLLLHRSLEALMKSFCEVQTCPLPQAGRGQAPSSRTPEHSATWASSIPRCKNQSLVLGYFPSPVFRALKVARWSLHTDTCLPQHWANSRRVGQRLQTEFKVAITSALDDGCFYLRL